MCCLCWSQERSQKQAWVLPANSPNISVVSTFPSAPSFRTPIDTGFKNEDPGKSGHPQHVMTAWLKRGVPSKMGAGRTRQLILMRKRFEATTQQGPLPIVLYWPCFCLDSVLILETVKCNTPMGWLKQYCFPEADSLLSLTGGCPGGVCSAVGGSFGENWVT